MIRILLWGCVLYRTAFVLTASINMDATDKNYDEYKDIEEEYNEERATNPRSRVLFEEEEINEQTESSATNFNAGNEKLDLSTKLSLVIPDSINMNTTEENYDEYQYSDGYEDIDEEYSEERATNPRSRVLFEDDEVNDEETKSNALNFNAGNEKMDMTRKISLVIPENRLAKIEMTLREINEIFGKKKFMKNKKGKLSRRDKKTARECRKKKLLFSTLDKKCHEPTTTGPCKNDKWFVAVKGQLQGVCKRNPCPGEENPILFNGTCSSLYGSCPPASRLFLNKRGVGFCDCDYGYSYSQEDDTCYKEHTPGPCGEKETWLRRRTPKKHRTGHKVFGKCKVNKCEEGMLEWKDKKCYKVDQGEMFAMCVAEEKGEIELEDEVLTCKLVMEGRAVVGGISRSCRRGRAWSRYRNRCVRVYSRG